MIFIVVVLLLLTIHNTAAGAAVQPAETTAIHTRRALQEAAANTTGGTGTLDPVVPLSQLPGEDLPSGMDALQLSAGSVTVSLVVIGTTAEQFKSSYQATAATITGTISGTPAARWQFRLGDTIDLSGASTTNTTASSRTTIGSSSSNSSSNTPASVSTSDQPSTTLSVISSNANSSNGNSSSANGSGDSSSTRSNGTRKLLQLPQRKVLQQAPGTLKVTLTLITTKPQIVSYRLSRSSTADAAAAAASVINSCTSEYCSRLVAAGLPLDSNSSIQISPDISTIVTNPSFKAKADQEAADRQKFLGAVIGGTVGGVIALLLVGILARWLWTRRGGQKLPSGPAVVDDVKPRKSPRVLSLGSKKLHTDPQTWSKLGPVSNALALPSSMIQESGIPDTPNSIQLAAIAAAVAAAQRGSNVHPTPFSTANQQSPDQNGLSKAASGINLPYPPQAIPNSLAATGMQTPSPFPTVLSTYGTPANFGTPELVPNPDFAMVRPEQLNQALQQYWASVQHFHGMWSASGTPKMTPQATPGYLTPKRSPLVSPQRSPMHSPKRSPRQSPRGLSPVRSRSGGYDLLQ